MERPKCCGKEMSTAEEAGISPKIVFSDGFWAWTGKDIAFVCSVCGAQILKKDLEKKSFQRPGRDDPLNFKAGPSGGG